MVAGEAARIRAAVGLVHHAAREAAAEDDGGAFRPSDEAADVVGRRVRDRALEGAAVHERLGADQAREAAGAGAASRTGIGASDGSLRPHAVHAAAVNPSEETHILRCGVNDEVLDLVVLSVELAAEGGGLPDGRNRRAFKVDVLRQHVDAGEVVRDGEELLGSRNRSGVFHVQLHLRPVGGEHVDLRGGERAAGHVGVAAAERTWSRAVGVDAAVLDRAVAAQVTDERADGAARAPDGAGAPAVLDGRGVVVEIADEAAVVRAGGAHVAARDAVGDRHRRVDVADEAADAATDAPLPVT